LLERFANDVKHFAGQHAIPIIHFSRGQKNDRFAAQHRAAFAADEGVVFIGLRRRRSASKGRSRPPLPPELDSPFLTFPAGQQGCSTLLNNDAMRASLAGGSVVLPIFDNSPARWSHRNSLPWK
jgi:hypothetical protein